MSDENRVTDDNCSVCCALFEARVNLERIGRNIILTGNKGPNGARDFNINLHGNRGIKDIVGQISKLQTYHRNYHSNGESDGLINTNFSLELPTETKKRYRLKKND